MALNEEDFQRIQASLLELKNENYALTDQCRKQKNALGDAQAKINVYEKELATSQKVISKSKKSQEVQQLLKDNESLQHKLFCQEEEFRHQNQTLLQELSKLVTTNENLETKIKHVTEAKSEDLVKDQLDQLKTSHEKEKHALIKEIEGLRTELSQKPVPQAGNRDLLEDPVVHVDATQSGVTFKKASLISAHHQPSHHQQSSDVNELEQTIATLNDEVQRLKKVQHDPSHGTFAEEGLLDWKTKCLELQDQLGNLQDKLKRKQDSYLQLQKEKEELRAESCGKLDALKAEKDTEIVGLREQSQRLQVQLNNGHSGFAEFKQKKSKEIQELNAKLETLQASSNAVGDPEQLTQLQNSLVDIRKELELKTEELASVKNDKEKLQTEYEEQQETIKELKQELETLKVDLEETSQASEKRKNLLEEMKSTIERKTSENEILQSEIVQLQTKVQEAHLEMEDLKAELDQVQSQGQEFKEKINALESKETDLEEALNQTKIKAHQDLENAKETFEDDLKILKAEHEIGIRDLNMQLEIANAQKNEFEELVENLKQDLKDASEDKKIVEKKNQSLIKDLKKQLLSEKQRSEKLSEKMQEHFQDPSSFSEVSKAELETDRTSNSSWSIYSGQNETSNDVSPSPEGPLPSGGPSMHSNADYGALLLKISHLQEDKESLTQKVHMLENSASAMADDLLRKSNLILHYCMEGKSDPLTPASKKESVSANERIKNVKKVMDLLVNPDQVEAQQKEDLHRMQRMLEETLTKNMHLQQDLENLSQEVVRLSKMVPPAPSVSD